MQQPCQTLHHANDCFVAFRIHEVSQRRFVLVSADHPIVSAVRSTQKHSVALCTFSVSLHPCHMVRMLVPLLDGIKVSLSTGR